jgi:mycothiol synthase
MHKLRMRRDSLADLSMPETPPGVTLRRAGPGDDRTLADLLAAAFADQRWTPEVAGRALLHHPEVIAVWIAEVDGRAAATASARIWERFSPAGYLHWVGARPEAAGHGLGRLVSLAALDALRVRGCIGAVLETDDHRRAALALYARLGFHPEPCAPGHAERWAAIQGGGA